MDCNFFRMTLIRNHTTWIANFLCCFRCNFRCQYRRYKSTCCLNSQPNPSDRSWVTGSWLMNRNWFRILKPGWKAGCNGIALNRWNIVVFAGKLRCYKWAECSFSACCKWVYSCPGYSSWRIRPVLRCCCPEHPLNVSGW